MFPKVLLKHPVVCLLTAPKCLEELFAQLRRLHHGPEGDVQGLPGVRVIAAEDGPPIVSLTVEGYAPADVAVLRSWPSMAFNGINWLHGPFICEQGLWEARIPFTIRAPSGRIILTDVWLM